jgi:hypothetical protein
MDAAKREGVAGGTITALPLVVVFRRVASWPDVEFGPLIEPTKG